MIERRSTIAALLAACMATAFAAGSFAQPAAPPAVLVQAATLTPVADQAEFIGRAAAVDKVELRARVKGFLGPRKFEDGDMVKKDQVVFTIEPETYQASVDQKLAQRDSMQAALTNADLQLSRATELLRTNTGTKQTYDQRLSEQLQAKANLEDARAQLRDAEIQLSYTTIKSPIARRIRRPAGPRAPSAAMPRPTSPIPPSSRRSPAASAAPRSRPATSSAPTPACWRRW